MKRMILVVAMTFLMGVTPPSPPSPPTAPGPVSPVPVLMYHDLTEKGKGSQYVIPIKMFTAQMEFLVREGYHTITTRQYADFLNHKGELPAKPVMLTFDDWYPAQYKLARPVLNRLKLHAVFFVYTSRIDSPEQERRLKELQGEGQEIASHTVHHYYLTQSPCNAQWKCCRSMKPCTVNQIREEIFNSRDALTKVLGAPPFSIGWPGAFWNDLTIKMAMEAGYRATYGVENQVMENGVLTNRVGLTKSPELIYRTEIGGMCNLKFFPTAVTTQRCCLTSTLKFYRHCVMMEP